MRSNKRFTFYFLSALKKIRSGFTLTEIMVYVGLLALLAVFVANFLIRVTYAYQQSRAEREVLSNARLILEQLATAIASSESLYIPASRFHTDEGQLSLATRSGADTNHTLRYIDFWADAGQMMMREEGAGEIALSAPSVRVATFRLEPVLQGLGREAVHATVSLEYANGRYPSSITLNATTALRGRY